MSDHYALLAACAEIRQAYHCGDTERLLAQFAPEFGLVADGQASVEGTAGPIALRAYANSLFRDYQVVCFQAVPYITVLQDTAWLWGYEQFKLTSRHHGGVQVWSYRLTRVWTRMPDIGWRVTFQMTQPDDRGTFTVAELEMTDRVT